MTKVDPRLIEGAASSVEGLLRLLVDGLDWPIPQDADLLDDADLLLNWDPTELNLDPSELGTLTSIQQIAPLTSNQPFGVFVLSFEGGRLPIGALRRVVRQLVRRRRRKHVDNPTWELGDLLFFCHSDDGQGYVHIVALRDDADGQDLRTISWSSNPTPTRRTLLSEHTLPDLVWPDPQASLDEWRHQWRSAFTGGYRQGVKTADQLSQRMAEVAADIRDEISDLLAVETPDGPLHQLLADMRLRLDAGIDESSFGNVFAQTLVYGLLSARVSHPEKFEAAEAHALLDFENPLLDAIYTTFMRHADDSLDLDHLGLTDLAHTLAVSDIDALLADFGAYDRRDDPVIYLYEEFLDRYDKEERRRLGAYYTPIPLVSAIIRLTDHALMSTAGLEGGITDSTSWEEWAKSHNATVPEQTNPSLPVIQMLDPATGTGTFLLQWLRAAASRDPSNTERHLDGMAALEISLASYAVAHLKTSLELPSQVRDLRRAPIFLADALAGPQPDLLPGLEDPIAAETELAHWIKFTRPATVIVGNPPYQRLAREEGGGWITAPRPDQPDLLEDVLAPAREHTIFSTQRSLYNLYVYFWRWSMWKAFEQTTSSPAVVSYVTASSWLQGPGFLGLRRLARELADDIWVVDLGGDNRGARADENVFGIETGVAIVVLARKSTSDRSRPARVLYTSVTGSRGDKLAALDTLNAETINWTALDGDWFSPFRPDTSEGAWATFPLLSDLLPWQQPGCIVSRTWPVAPEARVLEERWRAFVAIEDLDERARAFSTAKTGRNIYTRVPGTRRLCDEVADSPPPRIVGYGYRSFDRQFIFDDPRVAKTESPSLWASRGPEQIFMVSPGTAALGNGPGAVVFLDVPDFHAFRGSNGGKDVIPLYRDAYGTANADPALLKYLSEKFARNIGVEDLFSYVYAILAGGDYTSRFAEPLAVPGSRIPLTADPDLFARVVEHGQRLIAIQTHGLRFSHRLVEHEARTAPEWTKVPTRLPLGTADIKYDPAIETLSVADGRLTHVSEAAWAFQVSGMNIVRKWLGYRTEVGRGRAARSTSLLDQIRPKSWPQEWTRELAELVQMLESTCFEIDQGSALLSSVLAGPLLPAEHLPAPPPGLRKVPKSIGRENQEQGSLL